MFEENKKRGAGASAHPPRARPNGHGDVDTDSGAFRGPLGRKPGAKWGQDRGRNGTKKRTQRRPRGGKDTLQPLGAPGRPRVGILRVPRTSPGAGALPAPVQMDNTRLASSGFSRVFAKSLFEKFLQHLNNVFPLSATPTHPALACAHALTYTHSQAHPAPLQPRPPATRPPQLGLAPAWPRPGPLSHSPASSPGRRRGRPRPAAGSPRAAPGRRSHASSTWAGEPRAPRARSAESRAERGHGLSGSRG